MHNFVVNYLYIITFLVIVIFAIFVAHFKTENFNFKVYVFSHKKAIAAFLGLMQLVFFIIFMINNLINLFWYYSLVQDLCPSFQIISVITFVLNHDKGNKMIMSWLIIGATMTMLTNTNDICHDTVKLISYFQHSWMLIQGFFLYIMLDKYQKKELISILYPFPFLFAWILISGFIPWQVTGEANWATSSTALLYPAIYHEDSPYAILANLGMPYPLPTIIFYLAALLVAYGIIYWKIAYPSMLKKAQNYFNQLKNKKIKK